MKDLFEDTVRQFEKLRAENAFPELGVFRRSADTDVSSEGKNILVKIDLPGVRKEDIEIILEGRTLVVNAEKEEISEEKERTYHRKERSYAGYHTEVVLPEEVDTEKVGAEFRNGVLKLTFHKLDTKEAKWKQIKLQ